MQDQLENEYRLNLFKLRGNYERQGWRVLYVESAENGKLEGERKRGLIPEALRGIITESHEQIKLAENLLTQILEL